MEVNQKLTCNTANMLKMAEIQTALIKVADSLAGDEIITRETAARKIIEQVKYLGEEIRYYCEQEDNKEDTLTG